MSQVDRSPAAADARFAEMNGDQSVIPEGHVCYSIDQDRIDPKTGQIGINLCPYWATDKNRPQQMNGYCALLKAGDWEDGGTLLLWDQCKECGIKDEFDEDEILNQSNDG